LNKTTKKTSFTVRGCVQIHCNVHSRDMVWIGPLGKNEYYTNMPYYLSTYLHISECFNLSENSSDHLFFVFFSCKMFTTQKC